MLRGYCIDPDILQKYPPDTLFYLFPHGEHNFYVSRFPEERAHTGSYQRTRFSIVDEAKAAEWLPEPPKKTKSIERNVYFSAELVWSYKQYHSEMIGKTLYVIARGQGLHVDVYSSAKFMFANMLGCFPIHWFKNFKVVDREVEIETEETVLEQALEEEIFEDPGDPQFFEQITLF